MLDRDMIRLTLIKIMIISLDTVSQTLIEITIIGHDMVSCALIKIMTITHDQAMGPPQCLRILFRLGMI